ncbi:MAG: type II toxin-antitoxin system PemK/MazF family toxin [Candidatus Pacebacteria bacterium]|nr:type II toxin-antitoxin system PemK/MazF family toxin [Candidatus Paceibacterota bacterium]
MRDVENTFLEWSEKKKQIDSRDNKPPFLKECEIWWCSVGKNIGVEINGKGDLFARPILVLKKLSATVFIGIPFTTKFKEGTWFYSFLYKNKFITANLSQIRMFDYRRLVNKHGEIDEKYSYN